MKLPAKYSKLGPSQRRLVREEYINRQNGKCMWCGEDLKKPPPDKVIKQKINWNLFPENFLRYPVHLQHCHVTDLTEGAVHNYCNAVMWQYHDR